MSQPEWFGPIDKLSWQIGQMTLLFDYLLAFGVCLLVLAAVALVIQLIGFRQLMRAEKPKHKEASRKTLSVSQKSQPLNFRQAALRTARVAAVRRKQL